MSRIGKKPVPLASGVSAKLEGNLLKITGPKGNLEQVVDPRIKMQVEDGRVVFERSDDSRSSRALHGLYRALAANMCEGVTTGFSRGLEVHGTGFGAKVEGGDLVLSVGFCHPVHLPVPTGLEVSCPTAATIQVSGIDKQQVGDFAAKVRRVKPPEPYKGKGIRYAGEAVRRKAGKTLAGK